MMAATLQCLPGPDGLRLQAVGQSIPAGDLTGVVLATGQAGA